MFVWERLAVASLVTLYPLVGVCRVPLTERSSKKRLRMVDQWVTMFPLCHLISFILTAIDVLLILSLPGCNKRRILRPWWERYPGIINNLITESCTSATPRLLIALGKSSIASSASLTVGKIFEDRRERFCKLIHTDEMWRMWKFPSHYYPWSILNHCSSQAWGKLNTGSCYVNQKHWG